MHTKHIQHLYWRAGFGILPSKVFQLEKQSRASVVDHLFRESQSATKISIDLSEFKEFNLSEFQKNLEVRAKFMKLSREKMVDLNAAWVGGIANNKELLRERMTLFWANHFVCDDNNVVHMQQFVNLLKEHALGNFGDFTKAVSKSASMIKYLNTKQNKKRKPNENFARELMELFTLGIGHYTENDIKESARAFTGYNHNFKGDFWFRQFQHDTDQKTFLGQTGNFDGDAIIDIILKKKQCAKFICEKIYRYFVNNTLNASHIAAMTKLFYKDYSIEKLMRYVLSSDWFYDEKHIGTKIKSPVDLLLGIHKVVPLEFKDQKDLIKIQRLLGQVLLRPPNVAGWEGGNAWIDVNTIMVRLRLPSLVLNHAQIPHKTKGDFSDSFRDYYFKKNKGKLPFKTEANWDSFFSNYGHYSNAVLKANIISTQLNEGTETYLKSLNNKSQRDYCVQLMSLPEYQMC